LPQYIERFTERFSPESIDKNEDPIRALGHFELLGSFLRTPYFSKFLISKRKSIGRRFLAAVAQVTLLEASIIDFAGEFKSSSHPPTPQSPNTAWALTDGCLLILERTLAPFMSRDAQIKASLPGWLRLALIDQIKIWKFQGSRFKDSDMYEGQAQVLRSIHAILEDRLAEDLKHEIRKKVRGWMKCDWEACDITSDLKVCSR
jgi:hypothetical protein